MIRYVSDVNIVLDDPNAPREIEIANFSRHTDMSEEDHEGDHDNDAGQATDSNNA